MTFSHNSKFFFAMHVCENTPKVASAENAQTTIGFAPLFQNCEDAICRIDEQVENYDLATKDSVPVTKSETYLHV